MNSPKRIPSVGPFKPGGPNVARWAQPFFSDPYTGDRPPPPRAPGAEIVTKQYAEKYG